MTTKTPVALFIFSNDFNNRLNVETELKVIEKILRHYEDKDLLVAFHSFVSIDELFELFNHYKGRIRLFHFAGHAMESGLQFNQTIEHNELGRTAGLSSLLGREVTDGQLQFVFLNGCSTASQVEQLKAVNVPNIIATNYSILDKDAIHFAAQFYKSWTKSDSPTPFESPLITLQQAFDNGLTYLKTKYTVHTKITTRGFVFNIEELNTNEHWELFTTNPDLSFIDKPTTITSVKTKKQQRHTGSGDNVKGDKIIINYPNNESLEITNTSNYLLPKYKYRWLFCWLPFLDFKQEFWKILNNGYFTKEILKLTLKNYITPSQYRFESEEEKRLLQTFGTKKERVAQQLTQQNVLTLFKKGFLASPAKTPILILADAGMGKTTLLQKLFVDYARTYPTYQLAFIYSEEKNTIAKINAIQDKGNTILFLDALDEDTEARKDLQNHIINLTEAITDFHKVFVTCRNQFFKNNSEEWKHLQGKTDVYRIELSAFTINEAKSYINTYIKKPITNQIAHQIFNRNQSFFTRPLLLSYLDFLAADTKYAQTYAFFYQVYEEIIQKWGKREAEVTQTEEVQSRDYTKRLIKFSKKVAQQLYENTDIDLLSIAENNQIINNINAQSRSLLTRNRITDKFEFTHRSFQEYFWATLFYDQIFREETAINGSSHPLLSDIGKYPYTLQFYNEMCWGKIVKIENAKKVTINGNIVDLGSNQLSRLAIANDVNALFTIPNRQIRAFAIKYKDNLFIENNDNQGIKLTNEKISSFYDISLVKKPIEYGYQLLRTLSQKDVFNHYFKGFFNQFNEALTANEPPLKSNIFIEQYFEEIFEYLIKKLKPRKVKVNDIWQLQSLTSLDLTHNKLSVLPSEIGQLQNLTSLSLSHNKLSVLPSEIGQLQSLTSLFLSYNKLSILPSEIGQLQSLTSLDLSDNKLSVLPSEIGQLQSLTLLNLNSNKLSVLPSEIGQLKSLTSLHLGFNKLSILPSEIGQLKSLTWLYLSHNELSVLPSEIGQLQSLTSLFLGQCLNLDLIDTFKKLKELQSLTSLFLSDNKLSVLPSEIGQLKSLTSLDLSNNELSVLPSEIGQLKSLTSLYLNGNRLSVLPSEIWQLQSLNSLSLGYCLNLDLIDTFKKLKELQSLTSLDLSSNELSVLPSEIGQLKSLTSLDLSHNKLSILPSEIGQLQSLTSLSLDGNKLSILPSEIGQLQSLTSLSLDGNKLSVLPSEIGQLQSLNSLYLDSNELSVLPSEIGQLQSLTSLYLNDNKFSEVEKQKIKNLLPNCKIKP
jgi:Leucine-rich repeat (LRR) protein